jgi:hypothetical protein
MAGVYESGTGVFDGNNSKLIRLQGAPVRLAAEIPLPPYLCFATKASVS